MGDRPGTGMRGVDRFSSTHFIHGIVGLYFVSRQRKTAHQFFDSGPLQGQGVLGQPGMMGPPGEQICTPLDSIFVAVWRKSVAPEFYLNETIIPLTIMSFQEPH